MTLVLTIDQLRDVVGREVAVSDWIEVSQTIIDEFAEATRDAQWIHVDTERAARESPFLDSAGRRCTVAHGFLTMSGDFVMVHVGYAIQKVSAADAQTSWELFDEALGLNESVEEGAARDV